MRAAVRNRYGPPQVVRVREVPVPAIGPRDLLVRVHVTSVTRTDCGIRGAKPFFVRAFTGVVRPKASILGGEFAGVVEAIGPEVASFEIGARVFGFSEQFGAHAEYLRIAEAGPVATIPSDLSFEEAAPSTEASYYAFTIVKAAKVRPGQRILVNGATGAIGSAAVQLLKERGAVVTAVCDTPNIELVRGLGADRIIDRNVADFTQDEARYSAVVDAVGKSSFGRCKRLLEPGGQYLSTDLGPLWTTPLLALVTRFVGDKRARLPVGPDRDQAVIEHFRRLLESGAFRPVIDRRYPLQEIVEAYRYVEAGRKVGNVLITVSQPGARVDS
jgi:NADPH:quinone reductase-like Zn-dependent oxidoreductase